MDKFAFWHWPAEKLYIHLHSRPTGLTWREAAARLKKFGPNSLKAPGKGKGLVLFLSQFKSPLIFLLLGAAVVSALLDGKLDAAIIFAIVIFSGVLGYFQERGAMNALEGLLRLVETKAGVIRDGKESEIPAEQVVPGDLLVLRAGDLVPADCILLEANHFFVDEATLTGESAPVEKSPGELPLETPHLKRTNALFMGTMVASGVGTAIAVATGRLTEFGHLAERVRFRPTETAFEAGVRRFGFFLLEVTLILVIAIFAFNIYFERPVIESFLFSLALAVGLTPQLLPAIISVNLAHGARRMAKKKVIVKRLASIENFGQMDVLCSDKTGTVTLGKISLDAAVGVDGKESASCALYAFLNAHFQSGYANPLDAAILTSLTLDAAGWEKISETPYDFVRKRLSVALQREGKTVLIAKGAVPQMLSVCAKAEAGGKIVPLAQVQSLVEAYFEKKSQEGYRTLAVAFGEGEKEEDLTLCGFLHFLDPVKPGIVEAVAELRRKGVALKIVTGDHRSIAAHAAAALGMAHASLITGEELHKTSDRALLKVVQEKNVFAEIEPNEKERIILALRKAGHVVGFLGDGVNDVSALHSADVGIAVDSGADAAKEAADLILLEKDLGVLREGVEEGRCTFVNTLKYVYMAASANFGNMFSMAGASLFLNFLPLLPKQVLLTNFLTDFPEMAIATDRVDAETVARPVRWDLPFIRKFMIVFGLISSVFDFLTFGVLLYFLKADETLFQSGWFVESVLSATLIVLAIRTRGPIYRSKPGKLLLFSVLAVAIGVLFVPVSPLAQLFHFTPLPLAFYGTLAGIVVLYIGAVEIAKKFFFHRYSGGSRIAVYDDRSHPSRP